MRRFEKEMARLTCALGAVLLGFSLVLVPSAMIMADDGTSQIIKAQDCSPGHCTVTGDCEADPSTGSCAPDESNCAQADDPTSCSGCLCQPSPDTGCLCQPPP
jgi:hypothetical protein